MVQNEQGYQGDSRGKVADEGKPITNPIATKAWRFYDLEGVATCLGSDLSDFLIVHEPQADLYTAYDLTCDRDPRTTFDLAFKHSRRDVLVDPLALPSPQLEEDWPLTEAALFLPLAFNTRLEAATLVCPLPLVRPSEFYLRMFASLFRGYTLNLVYCPPESFKRYQTKLKNQEILRESFYDFTEACSEELSLPKNRPLPLLILSSFKIPAEVAEKISAKARSECEVLPLYLHEKELTVAIAGDRPRLDQISRITTELGGRITTRFVQVLSDQLEVAIKSNAVMEVASLTKRLAEEAEGYAKSESQEIKRIDTVQVQERIFSEDATVIDLVNTMLTHADKTLSTDIHLIPFRNTVRVCFRTDTLLHDFPDPIPKAIYQAICNRIKLMSTIDIQPTSIAQHGRFSIEIGSKMIEVRVCSQSTIHGDHVSLRLAEANAALKTIRELGFEEHEIDILQRSIDSDHGLTLVCGPTGSGKSTTLYATLFCIDRAKYSVMSGEDPVEREIPLVVQTEVSPPLTFDQYIAAAMRRDPDYIMVGETRTEETAFEVIRAAETGHVVYTTLHTNTAASAPHRLINLGIQPYMVADTLSSVIAQRLVPRLCPNCSFPAPAPTESDLETNGIPQSWFGRRSNFRDAHGCSQCNHTHFRGRILLAESFVATPRMKQLISNKNPSWDILEEQLAQGGKSIYQKAVEACVRGLIPFKLAIQFRNEETIRKASVTSQLITKN
ncbi:MAG: Flp pilus assembly complex ATPase component TadA [Verrucomicrobia bacterium]|nr:Flp pilus assembly complex ATPase component TadA [Verrucomicrobiota bacterium]